MPTTQNLVPCLGWTLVHFLWQGLAIVVWLMICLRMLRSGPAHQRYLAGCAALVAMVLAPAITFNHLARETASERPALTTDFISSAAPVEPVRSDAAPGPDVVVAFKAVKPSASLAEQLERGLPWLVIAWAAGVFALSGRLLIGWLQVRRLTRIAAIPLEGLWGERLADLAKRLNVSKPVRLLQSALVEVPTVIGWLRPVILLPASCLAGLTTTQLEAVLAHELAHIRRHDYLVNLLQSVTETLLFYHPAVWWVSRRIREEREHCCDDLAVRTCGDRVAYARALATLEELRLVPPQLAVAAGGAPLLERIRRLAGRSDKEVGRSGWLVAVMLSVTAAVALTIAFRSNRALAEEKKVSSLSAETSAASAKTNASAVAISDLVQEGKLLFEAGKLDNAEAKLMDAYKADSTNVAVLHLLDSIAAKRVEAATQKAELPGRGSLPEGRNSTQLANSQASTNIIHTSKGRQSILSKLDRIRIDSVKYDGLPLAEVIENLSEIAKSRDPDKVGINFFINRDNPAAAVAAPGGVGPTTSLPVAALPTEPVDVGAVTVKINPALNDVRLADVLDAITKTADKPIKYSIEAYAVVFSAKGEEPVELHTRVYHVDPNKFRRGLESVEGVPFSGNEAVTNSSPGVTVRGADAGEELQVQLKMRQFLTALGVDLNPANPANIGKSFFLNERKGTLMLHSTAQDLDIIGAAIETLTCEPPEDNRGKMSPAAAANIIPASTNVPLVTLPGAPPPQTSVQKSIAAINSRAAQPEPLFTRVYYIDTNAVSQGLNRVMAIPEARTNSTALFRGLRQYFAASGADFDKGNPANAGKTLFYTGMRGGLMAHGTEKDLEIIDKAIAKLRQGPPQINIKVKFVEIDEMASQLKGMDWLFAKFAQKATSAAPATFPAPPFRTPGADHQIVDPKLPVTNSIITQLTGILTEPKYRAAMAFLERQDATDCLTAPEVTTETDRQAQVQAVDLMTVVTGVNPVEKGKAFSTNDIKTQVLPFGPVLDAIPHVLDDGHSIEMTLVATVTEFLGYADSKKGPSYVESGGSRVRLPLPQIRLRQLTTKTVIQDGQTIVLTGLVAESVTTAKDKTAAPGGVPLFGRLFQSKPSKTTKKNLLVFVTPTLINPEGTRYHTEEERVSERESRVK
jgi:beta-lactamase regulating signal transducer with metallopeptidase domain/type II secretory pathway component GspD/PulD (secretin)